MQNSELGNKAKAAEGRSEMERGAEIIWPLSGILLLSSTARRSTSAPLPGDLAHSDHPNSDRRDFTALLTMFLVS